MCNNKHVFTCKNNYFLSEKGTMTMKVKGKVLLSAISFGVIFSINVPFAFAADSTSSDAASSISQATSSNANQIITNFGGGEDVTESLPMDLKIELANKILQNPQDVQIDSSTSEIDDLQSVETVVNYSDNDLKKLGMSQNDIQSARSDVSRLNSMTDSQIISSFKRDAEQVKLIRKALKPNSNYNQKTLSGNIVTTSDSIPSSKLSYSLVSVKNTAQTKHAASYELDTTYAWLTQPLIHAFCDQSAITWGQGMLPEGPTGMNYYENGLGFYSKSNTDYVNPSANSGTIFSFVQEISNPAGDGYCYLDHGYTRETMYQSKATGLTAQVLARFGHETLGFGFAIGVPPAICITPGLSEDTSAQSSKALVV
jgi:hypothetical protein